MYVVKAVETTFIQKIRTFNVDEIDTCWTFKEYIENSNKLTVIHIPLMDSLIKHWTS